MDRASAARMLHVAVAWSARPGEAHEVDLELRGGANVLDAIRASGAMTGESAIDISIQADEILRLKQTLSEILARHCGRAATDVSRDSDRDFFMGPGEAKAYGLIDEIVQTSK